MTTKNQLKNKYELMLQMWEVLLLKATNWRFYVVLGTIVAPVWVLMFMSAGFYWQHSDDISNLSKIPDIFRAQDGLLRSVNALTNNVHSLRVDLDEVKGKLREQGLILNAPTKDITTAIYK